MARKATLVCRPCGAAVTVSDLGTAVVECWECGVELEPAKLVTAKKLVPATAAAKKPAAKKAAVKPASRKASRKATAKKAPGRKK
jgi:hypothetical protein